MKIAVCGDSYCAASLTDLRLTGLRSHFSQILEDQYGYDIMHFAHGGFSNTAICFQIQEAIKHKPDVIIYNQTWSARVDMIIKDMVYSESGTANFIYYDKTLCSSHQPWTGKLDACVFSAPWQCIDQNNSVKITPEQKTAVDLYLKYLISYNMETTKDTWLLEYWHDRIAKAGILPVRFNDDDVGKVAYDFSGANREYDTPFHTDRATQEIVAANIHRKIVDKLNQHK